MNRQKGIALFILFFFTLNFIILANNDLAYADEPEVLWIEGNYDLVMPFSEGLAVVSLNGKGGYIDKTGKEVIPLRYNYADSFGEGLARVILRAKQDGYDNSYKFGFVDKSGKEVIQLKYDMARSFSEGLAPVRLKDRQDGNDIFYKCGFVDKTGKEVISLKYDSTWEFSEGLALVSLNGQWSYINKAGEVKVSPKHEYYYDDEYYSFTFSEGLAPVVGSNGKFVGLNGKCGYIDKTGKEVIPLKYDGSHEFIRSFSEGLAAVRLNGKYGYIDKSGKEVIPFKYDEAFSFREGLARVNLNYKYGYIDKTGKEVIPLKYNPAYSFSEGLAAVRLNGKYGYIDKTGKEVIPLKYDDAYSFSDDVALIRLNGKWGIIHNPLTSKEITLKNPAPINLIKGSKTYLKLKTEPKDAELTYISKNPDLIEVLPNGEIIGLKAGSAEIEVIANKWGYAENKILVPVKINDSLTIDLSWISKNNKLKQISAALEEMLAAAEAYHLEDSSTLKEIVQYINLSIQKLANTSIKAKNNQITINAQSLSKPIKTAKESKSEFEDLLKKYHINLDRDINSTIKINPAKVNSQKPITIELASDLKTNLEQIDALNISTDLAEITLQAPSLIKELEKLKKLTIQLEQTEQNTKIVFLDDKNQVIKKLANNISLELPIRAEKAETSSVFYKSGAIEEQIGGQYNPAHKTMAFESSRSGEYYIAESYKEYKDLDHLSEEEKQAIRYMTSKGYIADKGENLFDPDTEISRAEFTAFIVKVFYVLDRDLKVSFSDISEEDWYYNYIASSEAEGIIKGFPDNTFRANDIIDREQIVAVCARALHEKKQYLYPEDPIELIPFLDSEEISDWAQKEVALAYRESLIDMTDNRCFEAQKPMTRADATVIVYRLFQLLYETTPEAIDTSPTTSQLPIVPIAAAGAGLIGLGLIGVYSYRRKKTDEAA